MLSCFLLVSNDKFPVFHKYQEGSILHSYIKLQVTLLGALQKFASFSHLKFYLLIEYNAALINWFGSWLYHLTKKVVLALVGK